MNEQNFLNRGRWDFSTHELHSYLLKSEVDWRLNMTEFHTLNWAMLPSSQSLYDTLLLLFTTTWQPFISSSRLLPPFLLHCLSVPCNPFVCLGACWGLSFDKWKKQNFQSDMVLTGSFCLPFRPISLTSSVSLHSSPAMQCFQTISMRMKSECYRLLVYKPTWKTIPIISQQFFFCLFHVLWLNIKHFPVYTCLLQVDDGLVAMYWASS